MCEDKDYYSVVCDDDRWKIQNRYQGMGRPDQDGRFTIPNLPPGDYYIVALDKIDPGQISDPEFLDAVRVKATAITLREGEARTVDLKLQN